VGLPDVHLPGGWHLNVWRVSIPPVPRRGQERHDKIRRRWAILPPDLREDPAFAMDSEWRDCPAYEPCPRCRPGLLGDTEYDYVAEVYPQQQVSYWVPLLLEEEEAEYDYVAEVNTPFVFAA
jgi:hypothetical protein